MPISPIELFRPQQLDGVAQILGSANNALTGALNNSVQIGRDSANLRATQEREYLAEREKAANMEQRKAEFLKRSQQLDRQFGENVLQDRRNFVEDVGRDRRNFAEDVGRDRRDFQFKQTTDERNAKLNRLSTLSNILNADERLLMDKEKLDLENTNKKEKDAFLDARAKSILDKTSPPGVIGRIKRTVTGWLGGEAPPEAPPEENISNGKDLREIGIIRRDPLLVSRGDELISTGEQGILKRNKDIRNTPLPTRPPTQKAGQTDEDHIKELTQMVGRWQSISRKAEDDGDDDLKKNADALVSDTVKKLRDLQKKMADKGGTGPVDSKTVNPVTGLPYVNPVTGLPYTFKERTVINYTQ